MARGRTNEQESSDQRATAPENHVVLPHFRLETLHAHVESRGRFDAAAVQEQVSAFLSLGFP